MTALAYAVGAILAFMYIRTVWARRENLWYNVRALLICTAFGAAIFFFMQQNPQLATAAPFTAMLVGGLMFRMRPGRKRRMRAADRRRAVARWTLKTGKKFDPRKHEIDHTVPFSRGGSSTADNLKVLDRAENRRKGNRRSTWWDLLGRR